MNIINMIFLIIFLLIFPLTFMSMNYLMFKKKFLNREKNSSFECGFDMMSNPRMPFSIHFFLISLMFLIFDMEITLLLPMVIHMKNMNNSMTISTMFFMMILILSIYIEYSENMLEWKF